MKQVLYASLPDNTAAQRVVTSLLACNLKEEDISLIISESEIPVEETFWDFVQMVKEGGAKAMNGSASAGPAVQTADPDKPGLAALTASSTMLVPGVGLVIGKGSLATAIAGSAGTVSVGQAAGSFSRLLRQHGVLEERALQYDENLSRGRPLIGITLPKGELHQAPVRQILSMNQATHFATAAAPR